MNLPTWLSPTLPRLSSSSTSGDWATLKVTRSSSSGGSTDCNTSCALSDVAETCSFQPCSGGGPVSECETQIQGCAGGCETCHPPSPHAAVRMPPKALSAVKLMVVVMSTRTPLWIG